MTLLTHTDRQRFVTEIAVVMRKGPLISELPEDSNVTDLKATKVRFALIKIVFYLVKFVISEKSYRNILLCALFLGVVSSLTKPVAYLLVVPVSIYLSF